MRLLVLHSDFIKFEVTKKTKFAEDIGDELKKNEMEECLTVFASVENDDVDDIGRLVAEAAASIRDIAAQTNTKNVFLYPYVHLTSNPAPPDYAKQVFPLLEAELSGEHTVKRAPFGYYKAFTVSCKGHPLSELSREIHLGKKEDEVVSEAVTSESRITSSWYILTPEGQLMDAKGFNYAGHDNLKAFVHHETEGSRVADRDPPHVEIMKKMELVDYEPGSDSGNLRWYPKGTMVKRLLEEQITSVIHKYGGMEVETPIMYDFEHPKLSRYLHRFPARQYTVLSGDKKFFLRFAACFGQYLIQHDMTISYKHLPLRLYELTHYSFRREQGGELSGLRRLRAFTMPDMHTLVQDMDSAKAEFLAQYQLCMDWMAKLGVKYEAGIRFVRSFYEENKDFAVELARQLGRPVLIEMWDDRPFYFVMKFEFNFVDAIGKASALSTVQIDIENTERFDLTYINEEGEKAYPLLLHASVSGAVDRNVFALLEQAYMDSQKGKKPMLPVWLSPTQVRLLPINEGYIPYCNELAESLGAYRVDVDDRSESLGKKIRGAEKEWVPYILVVGDKERESGVFPVRDRAAGSQRNLTLAELSGELAQLTGVLPSRPLPLPYYLSKRPKFRG